MPRLDLSKLHPNLYRAIMGHAVAHAAVGGFILYSSITLGTRRPFLVWFFVFAFFFIAAVLVYGLRAPHYTFVRYGLVLGLALIGFLALVFSFSVGLTLNEEQTIRLAFLVPPWGYWAWQHQLCLQEPPANPNSERE